MNEKLRMRQALRINFSEETSGHEGKREGRSCRGSRWLRQDSEMQRLQETRKEEAVTGEGKLATQGGSKGQEKKER